MDSNIDMLGAIQIAMEAEQKAFLFYKEGADKTEHPQGKALFLQLAEFENNHYVYLKKLLESLQKTGLYITYSGTTFSKTAETRSGEVEGEPKRDQVLDVLNLAVEAERLAQERYAELATKTADPSGQDMFRKLSKEEGLHLRILEDEFYNMTNQGSWSSGNLWSE